MFGFGNRSMQKSKVRGGALSGGALRRAAVAGLGMLVYRWWRNRRPESPPVTGREQETGRGQVW